jgi:hypothetical protein
VRAVMNRHKPLNFKLHYWTEKQWKRHYIWSRFAYNMEIKFRCPFSVFCLLSEFYYSSLCIFNTARRGPGIGKAENFIVFFVIQQPFNKHLCSRQCYLLLRCENLANSAWWPSSGCAVDDKNELRLV